MKHAISRGLKFLEQQVLSGNYGLACRGLSGESKFSDQKGHLFSIFFILEAMKEELPEMLRTIFLTRILSEETNGHWGYSPRAYYVEAEKNPYFVDADDTAFALRSLRAMGIYRSIQPLGVYLAENVVYEQPIYVYRTFLSDSKPELSFKPSPVNNLKIHPEVNANVLQSLKDTDLESPFVLQFAESIQQDDGLWPSYFYPLPYYSTWMFVSMLKLYGVGQHLLDHTVRGLLKHQDGSGGFGKYPHPLSTALALSCLQIAGYSGLEVERGIKYIVKTQTRSGSWVSEEDVWKFHHPDGDVWTAKDINNVICTSLCLRVLKNHQLQ